MKKVLCIVFSLLMAVGCLSAAGCGNDDKPTVTSDVASSGEDTRETSSRAADEIIDLPEVKFNREFTIITQSQSGAIDILSAERDTGDPLTDAIRARNITVQDKYGVTFNIIAENAGDVTAMIRRDADANSGEYDLAFVQMVYSGPTLAMDNAIVPISKLPYADPGKRWWDKDLKDVYSIENNLMALAGDISPYTFNCTACMYFNKTLFDNYDIKYPYEEVKNGTWTIDRLIEITKDSFHDVSGDSSLHPIDTKNIYGLACWQLDVPYSLYYGCGGMIVTKDNEDKPIYTPHIERDTEIYNKIYRTIITNKAYFEKDLEHFEDVAGVFASGRAFFYDGSLQSVEQLRDMDDEFGILPMPKLNKEQDGYKSFVNGAGSVVCVPASAPDLECSSIILEALASETYYSVTPVLYESYLKRKAAQDYQSADMIDFIVRNRVFDIAYIYLNDGIGSYVRDLLRTGSTDISSTLKSYQRVTERRLSQIIQTYEKSLRD